MPITDKQSWFIGHVIQGNQNGRKYGFPTANILLKDKTATIDTGVYAVEVMINNINLHGMLYVGTRPTLNLQDISVEIHLFDFDQEIYGQEVSFHILKKFHEDKKFNSIQELISAIDRYKEEILLFFNE